MENLIELFPPDGLTAYYLNVCNEKLKEIKDTFRDFSGKVSTFCIKYANVDQMPHLLANQSMTVQWWEEQEKSLLQKVVQHERDIGHAASQLQEQIQAGISDSQKEYWKKDLELREEHLALMKKSQKESEENEKAKANALAQSKYDEILAYSVDLKDSLSEVEDWSEATRAQVITGMKSLEKWSLSYDNLNKAHRAFNPT